MQHYSLEHLSLLPSPIPSTTGSCFCFDSVSSFFLELFLHSSPVAYWAPVDVGVSSFSVASFLPFHTVHRVLKARIVKWFASPFSSRSERYRKDVQIYSFMTVIKTLGKMLKVNFFPQNSVNELDSWSVQSGKISE